MFWLFSERGESLESSLLLLWLIVCIILVVCLVSAMGAWSETVDVTVTAAGGVAALGDVEVVGTTLEDQKDETWTPG